MSRVYPIKLGERPPNLPRRVVGWLAIAAGLAMLVLPGPGLLVLALGVILLGRRHPILRRGLVLFRIQVRRLSQSERRAVRWMGRWLRTQIQGARSFIREQLQRHAHGQPLSRPVQIWIGTTIALGLLGLGASVYTLLR